MWSRLTLLTLLVIPLPAWAITISEIAWMGGTASHNHEWIELYNGTGGDVVLEGWTLSDGNNLNINLSNTVDPSGIIEAGAYAVLERTSDDTVSGPAFLIYTGSLVNSGATLTLRDASGQIRDQVAGGENWQNIGGDNITKETAQYTPSGWITAVATPGQPNATVGSAPSATATSTATSTPENTVVSTVGGTRSVSRQKSPPVSMNRLPPNELALSMNLPDYVYVNEPVNFTVTPRGVADTLSASLRYTWNFGDVNATRGRTVTHAYEYPGTYVVQVTAEFASLREGLQHTITVLPVTVSLTRNEAGDIQLHNDAPYPLDLSKYTLTGHNTLIIPKGTVILPRGTITIPWHRVEDVNRQSLVLLRDALGNVMAKAPIGKIAVAAARTAPEVMAYNQAPTPPRLVVATPPEPLVLAHNTPTNEPTVVAVTEAGGGERGEGEVVLVEAGAVEAAASTAPAHRAYAIWLALILLVLLFIWLTPRRQTAPPVETQATKPPFFN